MNLGTAKTFKDENCHPEGCYFCQEIAKQGCEFPICSGFITSGEFEILRFQYALDTNDFYSEYNAVQLADLDPKHLDVIRVLMHCDNLPADFDEETRFKVIKCLESFKELISEGKNLLRREY